jgi:hypothetical protein
MLEDAIRYGSLEDILKEAGISQEEFNEAMEQE